MGNYQNITILKGPISYNIWLSSWDSLERNPWSAESLIFLPWLFSFPCHSYRIIQNQPFTRGCWILKGQLVTNTGNGITIYSCRRSLQSFHRGLPTLVLDTFSCKMLRAAHFPLQSLWAELFLLAAQVTVPTTLKAVPAILPPVNTSQFTHFSSVPHYPSHLPHVRLKKQSFPQWSWKEHPSNVWKHAFTTGGQKPLKKQKGERSPFTTLLEEQILNI